jgi:ubiquinone/menaquinone biosynthesis C-methylase UbiE
MPTDATTREWRTLADDDPLYAIAAWPGKEHGGWTREEFYAAGLQEWADFESHWTRYASLNGTCLEIGCGAGRITNGLTRRFDRVIGIDVSDRMLALAREQVPNADYTLVDSTQIPLGEGAVDAVFTCHVLQHLETADDVTDYLREAHRVLRPGGTIMAHLMLAGAPRSRARRLLSELRLRRARAMNANRGAYARVNRYRPDQVRAMLELVGFTQVEMCEFRLLGGASSPHSFWFGRKSGDERR